MNARDEAFVQLYRDLRIAGQLRFYRRRGQRLQRARLVAIWVRNVLLLLAALSGVVAQFTVGADRALAGVAGAVLAASGGAVTAVETLWGFGRLSKLYDDAAASLAVAELEWEDVTSDDRLDAGLLRVERILRTENGQWGQLTRESSAASVQSDAGASPLPEGRPAS